MKKVLLAIDGATPSTTVFQYAIQLCKQLKAQLSVLQIIRPKNYMKHFNKARKKTKIAKSYIEGSLAAATFAEAGEPETAKEILEIAAGTRKLLRESEKAGIPYQLTMKSGQPDQEVVDYVNADRNIVLTIYDTRHPRQAARKKDIRGMLPIPLVMIKS
jgi:nucleotide-binding universal stress UspA family protein